LIEVAFLVSSGSLLDMRALKEIGLMRDELFISYVDVELCLRAKALGYRIIACCAAVMEHNLGDQRLRIGRWMLPLHSPLRHFHLLRSGVYMQKLPQIPAVWKRADRRQLVRSFIVFSIVGLPRLHEFNAMLRGWIAGRRMHVQPVPTLSRPAGPVGS
jgi:rhamnosyltransferase